MFALVKLASTRGVNVVESLFYRQCGSALCATGLVALGPGFVAADQAGRAMSGAWRSASRQWPQLRRVHPASARRSDDDRLLGADFRGVLAAIVLDEPTGKWRWGRLRRGSPASC